MDQTRAAGPLIRYNRLLPNARRPPIPGTMMHEFVLITTTSGDHSVADQIAAELVDRRLVACAQISGPIKSVYRWEGAVEFTEEVVLQLKTTTEHVDAVKATILRLHPYDVPEIIVQAIVDGSDAYLQWIRDQTGSLD